MGCHTLRNRAGRLGECAESLKQGDFRVYLGMVLSRTSAVISYGGRIVVGSPYGLVNLLSGHCATPSLLHAEQGGDATAVGVLAGLQLAQVVIGGGDAAMAQLVAYGRRRGAQRVQQQRGGVP